MLENLFQSLITLVGSRGGAQEKCKDFIVTNPLIRQGIRPDFPPSLNIGNGIGAFVELVEDELKKEGSRLQDIKSIYIAYPHKHPEIFPAHRDPNSDDLLLFKRVLEDQCPQIDWRIATSIVETVNLGRSNNQGSVHALTGKQVYEVYEKEKSFETPAPNLFVTSKGECSNPYFIVADHMIDQGTTMANLINFLEHNEGKVLGVLSNTCKMLAQEDTLYCCPEVSLSGEFANPSRNIGRLPELARMFSSSAKLHQYKHKTPQECMEVFERALNEVGHSVFALTDGECIKLIREVETDKTSFPALVSSLYAHKSDPHSPPIAVLDVISVLKHSIV